MRPKAWHRLFVNIDHVYWSYYALEAKHVYINKPVKNVRQPDSQNNARSDKSTKTNITQGWIQILIH